MPKLTDIAGVWNTVRELNVGDIRDAAEQPLTVAVVGEPALRAAVVDVLRGAPGRFVAASRDAVVEFDLAVPRERQNALINSAVVVLVLASGGALPAAAVSTADKLAMLTQPRLVALVGGEHVPETVDGQQPDLGGAKVVFLPDTQVATIEARLLTELAELLPDDQRVAAGRRLPGLREAVSRVLIGEAAFSNATYALTSGLPELIPFLNIPLNAADMLVLTKNQALLTYKLGLAYGAPPDFQAQMREIMPVIGSGFLWRQLARQLIGLIPGFGLLPKVAVAYAGTYAVGQSASLWYSQGEVMSSASLKQLYRRAMTLGKQRARELLDRRRAAPSVPGAPAAPVRPCLWQRLRGLFRRKPQPPQLPPPS